MSLKVPKGKPASITVVNSVEKLAPDAQPYVTDLNPDISDANLKFGIPQGEKGDKGDENIAIGCQSDFPNQEPEHDKIWYDPCDEAMDEYSIKDFLYSSYIAMGGTSPKDEFESAWKHFPRVSGFEIKFANSFEALGDPTEDKVGNLYIIPSNDPIAGDLFDEYIVIKSPSLDNQYMWEKWGGGGQIEVDLQNYYNKLEVEGLVSSTNNALDQKVTKQLETKVDKIEGSSLIPAADLTQITTNKTNIEQLQEDIKTCITTLTSSDNTVTITGDSKSKDLKVNMTNLISEENNTCVTLGSNNKLDLC